MKKIRLLKEARAEFLNQTNYYEKARSGSGVRFRLAVEEVFKHIAIFPKMGIQEVDSYRRVIVVGFPFSVIFK
jgi:toxin ParE1/3/4